MEWGQASMQLTALPWADHSPCKWNTLRPRICPRLLASTCGVKTKLSPAWDLQLSSESQCLKPFGNQSVAIPFFQNTAAPFAGFSLRLKGGAEICSSTSSQQGALSLISGMRQLNKQGRMAGRLQAWPVPVCTSWCTLAWASDFTAPQQDCAATPQQTFSPVKTEPLLKRQFFLGHVVTEFQLQS